jgi:hypothetical protein
LELAMGSPSAILQLICPDRPGLVSELSGWVAANGGNIRHADHHTDAGAGLFLSRIEWGLEGFGLPRAAIAPSTAALAARLGGEADFVRRFQREASILTNVRHLHIAGALASGLHQDTPWIAMELVEGGTLKQVLDRGERLPPPGIEDRLADRRETRPPQARPGTRGHAQPGGSPSRQPRIAVQRLAHTEQRARLAAEQGPANARVDDPVGGIRLVERIRRRPPG